MALPNPGMNFTPLDVLPAASLNDLVENIEALAAGTGVNDATITQDKLAPHALGATVATSETTGSTSYADLTTTTDSVTITIGTNGQARVSFSVDMSINSAVNTVFASFAVSGANTLAAADARAIKYKPLVSGAEVSCGKSILLTGLTPGSTTFKMKYRVIGSTGTYVNRHINVEAL